MKADNYLKFWNRKIKIFKICLRIIKNNNYKNQFRISNKFFILKKVKKIIFWIVI